MTAETFESLRPLLFSIAYRMLGTVSEAEDVMQDAFLRYRRAVAGDADIGSLKAYLSAVVTRLAIDELRSARRRREAYVGAWLPEPLLTDAGRDDPAAQVEQAESLSMAFLLLLQRLSPAERAAFLLHDVFNYGYAEIARILDRSETSCRQLASRARRRVDSERPRFEPSQRARDELAARFFSAVTNGDVDGLVRMLAADATVVGDGGGRAPQWMAPIVGADRVARLFVGLGRQADELGLRTELRQVNGQPGSLILDAGGRLINVFALDIVDGRVRTVRSVINPDKLGHIGPLADARAVLRRSASTAEPGGGPVS
ncbi:MAG: RNA polymerase sigma-70 factor [Candidatus Limnocylindria bacterium]